MIWQRFGNSGLGYGIAVGANQFRRSLGGTVWGLEAHNATKSGKAMGGDAGLTPDSGSQDDLDGSKIIAQLEGGMNDPTIFLMQPGLYLVTVAVVSGFIMPTGLDSELWIHHARRLAFYGTGQGIGTGDDPFVPEGASPFYGPVDSDTPPPAWPWASDNPSKYPGPSRSGYFASRNRDVRLPASAEGYSVVMEDTLTGVVYAAEMDKSGDPPSGGGWSGEFSIPEHYGSLTYYEEVDTRDPWDSPPAGKVIYAIGNGQNLYDPAHPWYYEMNYSLAATQLTIAKLDDAADIAGAIAAQTTRKTAHRLR